MWPFLVEKYFSDYEKHLILWSPIVKNQGSTAKNNQLNDVLKIKEIIEKEHGYSIELIN